MDEQTLSSTTEPEKTIAQATAASAERASSEHRQAYGTAKTENLRDSGIWRVLLPAVVIACCAALLIIPLVILIPLLYNSIHAIGTNNVTEAQLVWVWITMIIIELGLFFIISRGIIKIFLTQAGNYQR
ncbi:hypothetical protein [Dictyobacter formicarum]|uniref:ABC transmembrane type-1 domain-containing protein n=1 Tax=Dictyobacter formicarum TaxID=2778368 RepID=A0ABQ3VGP7_9CHLR|nr:hypothetical protein [Dictyobacter formicarum]GHO84543.1 hypothetical protein KSZ_25490 [Dictyobacter formicarum]